ncbi:hypothetical protein J6590_030595 [Homalodisca vitripennis]|nr:hypothetical protein J6590_030595 [Homalodisca vitripennis]
MLSEVRAKKPSLTLNLGTNGLKVTSETPPMAGQAGCLQGQDRSAVTYPSSSHAQRCLIRLSCDNHCTRYTAPLATLTECLALFPNYQRFLLASTRVCHPLPALTGGAGSELASPSSEGT